MSPRLFVVAAACAALATVDLALAAGVGHAAAGRRGSLEIVTVPAGRQLRFELAGRIYVTDHRGRSTVPAAAVRRVSHDLRSQPRSLRLLPNRRPDGSYFRLERWYSNSSAPNGPLYAALDLYRPVRFSLFSRAGRAIPLAVLDSFQMKRIDGEVITLTRRQLQRPVMLQASRVVRLNGPLVAKKLLYRIQRVSVGGINLIHRAQQSFLVSDTSHVRLRLLFYSVRFEARDSLFGFSIGSGIRLVYPNGHVQLHRFHGHRREARASLPRGSYHVSVVGAGVSPSVPVSVTRDHTAELKVFSYLDIAVVAAVFLAVVLGLALVRRPAVRRRLSPRQRLQPRRSARRAPAPAGAGRVDAADAAVILGVSRDFIDRHAAALGGVRVGNGPRSGWRFDPARLHPLPESPTPPPTAKPRRRRDTVGKAVELLPIRNHR
jgi:hypothetical protein